MAPTSAVVRVCYYHHRKISFGVGAIHSRKEVPLFPPPPSIQKPSPKFHRSGGERTNLHVIPSPPLSVGEGSGDPCRDVTCGWARCDLVRWLEKWLLPDWLRTQPSPLGSPGVFVNCRGCLLVPWQEHQLPFAIEASLHSVNSVQRRGYSCHLHRIASKMEVLSVVGPELFVHPSLSRLQHNVVMLRQPRQGVGEASRSSKTYGKWKEKEKSPQPEK
ncbi:hypothetical protein V8F33_000854 [Rhypophila sp. PSN 637]